MPTILDNRGEDSDSEAEQGSDLVVDNTSTSPGGLLGPNAVGKCRFVYEWPP
jgi:hypothetical protein